MMPKHRGHRDEEGAATDASQEEIPHDERTEHSGSRLSLGVGCHWSQSGHLAILYYNNGTFQYKK
jgi:hypothetical protein